MRIDEIDFYIDLLFYNTKLRCYVAIDLKTGEFKPEQAGKMNFWKYLKMSLTMNPIFTGKDRLKTNAGFISKGCLKALALKRGMKTQKKRARIFAGV